MKLAINFGAKTSMADVMLVSMASSEVLEFNVNACKELSDQEKQVLEEVREK